MIKKYLEYIKEELNWKTYDNAAKGLKGMGHPGRAKKISDHSRFHRLKMSMIDNYGDLEPFEIYAEIDEANTYGEYYKNSDTEKVTVYLSTWSCTPAEEANGCACMTMTPVWIMNTKETFLEKGSEYNDHKMGSDVMFLTESEEGNYTMCDDSEIDYSAYETGNNYIRFTNRKDAMRFRNLVLKDKHLKKELEESVIGCEGSELPPVRQFMKMCHQSIGVNMLFK